MTDKLACPHCNAPIGPELAARLLASLRRTPHAGRKPGAKDRTPRKPGRWPKKEQS